MTDFFKRLPAGTGKAVNKKQVQDFVKTLLFEKSLTDLADLVETDYSEMPGAVLGVIQTLSEAGKSGDFSRLKPLLDFAFEREGRARK